jgi:hypothetical protein
MEVKGTGIKTTRDFIKSKFGNQYHAWLESLPDASRKIFTGTVDVSKWYPIDDAYLTPVKHMLKLFYDDNAKKGGEEIGRYSADVALTGIYKVFLLVASPQFLMKRASKIMTTYYQPSEIAVNDNGNKSVTLTILSFPEIDQALEYRIAGWCKRALELAHCNGVQFTFNKALTRGDEATEIIFSWK